MKHYSLSLVGLLLVLASMWSCSESADDGGLNPTGGWAPENPIMKEFRFYPDDKDDWVVRLRPGEDPSGGAILMNANVTINKPYIYYKKTGENTATLSFNFQRIAYNGYGAFYQCEYELTFTSAHQGTYTGYMSVNLEEKAETGRFVFDSENDPVDDGQEQPGDDDGGQKPGEDENTPGGNEDEGSETSDPELLKIALYNVSPSHIVYQIQYRNPENYKNEKDYLRAGICYGTSPNPTIFDNTGRVERVIPYSNQTSSITELKENTTYYLRPFREVNGIVSYYKETSVKTVGTTPDSDLMLEMKFVEGNKMEYEYAINVNRSFKVDLNIWDTYGNRSVKELGYKQKGDTETGSYTYTLTWEKYTYFYLTARDMDSGITYESESLYNPFAY